MHAVKTAPAAAWLTAEVEAIFRVAYRLTGDPDDAEDLVQDVCERALMRAPELVAAEDRRRWLLRVLYNRFVDGCRQRRRSTLLSMSVVGAKEPEAEAPGMDPEAMAAQGDDEAALVRAWNRLEPGQQILLLLRAEGHDLGEIARIVEIDKPALSSRLHRARSSLAKHLNEERSALS